MREIIELTKELILFKSIASDQKELHRCAAFITEYLKSFGIPHQLREYNGFPSVMVMPEGGYAPVFLMTHMDVIDAPKKLFHPVEQDGKLYGRGSIDDKYAVALSMVLIKEYHRRLKTQGGTRDRLPLGMLVTSDEEIGGKAGAQPVLKEIKANFCIALDGGGLDQIIVKEKGMLKLKLISKGKAAHGARPWLGENAIEKLIDDYQQIKAFFSEMKPDHWHRTMNFSIVRAGKVHNQVPDHAEAHFDIRYTENDDMEALIAELGNAVEGELVVEGLEPVFQGGNSAYLDLLLEISGGTRVGFEHGASDARYLRANGIDGIVWGADGDLSQHSPDEHVNIDSVYALYRILDQFVERAESLGVEGPGV